MKEAEIIEKTFGIPANRLTIKNIQNWFLEPRYEHEYLEFKSGEVRMNDLARECCAMLNTAGGLIIVGSPREQYKMHKGKRGKTFCMGNIHPSAFKNAAWLQEQICKAITPTPSVEEVNVFQIKAERGKSVFLLAIETSSRKPCQLEDGRFYYRQNTSVRPMAYPMVRDFFIEKKQPLYKSSIAFHDDAGSPANILRLAIKVKNFSLIAPKASRIELGFAHVDEVLKNDLIYEKIKDKITIFGCKDESPLFDEREKEFSISLRHFFKPFYFEISVWSTGSSLHMQRFIYDPVNRKLIKHSTNGQRNEIRKMEMLEELEGILRIL